MKTIPGWARPAAIGAGILAGAYVGYDWMYGAPHAELAGKLREHRSRIADYEKALADKGKVREGLKAFGSRTLGGSLDEAEHRFRSTLNAIAEECGLTAVKVASRTPEAMGNPAGEARLKSSFGQALRKQTDFYVIAGDVKGTGTLEQVLRATAVIQAQPWVHRSATFSLKPDKAGEKFELRLDVATMFTPDLSSESVPEPERVALADTASALWAPVVAKNIFKEPPPDAPRVADRPPPPPPPPENPYADWKLTGVVESRLGTEALLLNKRSGQRLTLTAGGTVVEARFVSGGGERAVFEIGGKKFEVLNGQTLGERRPLD